MGFAYAAKAEAAPPVQDPTPPPGYPIDDYPFPGPPWAPGFPVTTLLVIVDDETIPGNPTACVARILYNGFDGDTNLGDIIQVTADILGVTVQLKKLAADSFADSITFTVSNYLDEQHGFDSTIILDLDNTDVGSLVVITCELLNQDDVILEDDLTSVVDSSNECLPSSVFPEFVQIDQEFKGSSINYARGDHNHGHLEPDVAANNTKMLTLNAALKIKVAFLE